MFGEKCSRCGNRVGKKHDFCHHCGLSLKGGIASEDLGFLGKSDIAEVTKDLPFMFRKMLGPLMKDLQPMMREINKQVVDEMNKQNNPNKDKNKVVKSFSVHIGSPGQKPVKISAGNVPTAQVVETSEGIELPKIDDKKLEKVKSLPRNEPETIIRRLSDGIIYEILLPGVKGLSEINISILEDAIEVKAIAKKEVFIKSIDVTLPVKDYNFQSEKLILELGLK